jgi:transposase
VKSIAFAGLDVHADTIVIEVVAGDADCTLEQGKIRFEQQAIRKYFRRLADRYDLRCCYEASGCGYVLARWLKDWDIQCVIIAPSLIPVRPGDRIKTDRRDARKLARLYKAGELTEVHMPTEEEEAVRSLVRCRETIVKEVVQSKNYVLKFIRLRGLSFREGKSNWTQKHWAWLKSLAFEGADAEVFAEYLALLEYKLGRLATLDHRLEETARSDRYREAVGKLCCLRGIGVQSAMVLIAETIDFKRFGNPRCLMGYYGLVPSEESSGSRRRLGGITKAGNSRCRRILIEAAWKYQYKPGLGDTLKERQLGQPPGVVAHSWKAQHRLHKKFWRIAMRKERQKAVVAVARELAGFAWAIMVNRFDVPVIGKSQVATA